MLELAPGNILQLEHFRRRVRAINRKLGRPARFIEIGVGRGWLSASALAEGCSGIGYDPSIACCEASLARNSEAVAAGRFRVLSQAFPGGTDSFENSFDLVVASMVLEHLTEEEIDEIFHAVRRASRPGGVFAAFVPAGMKYWGIEDDVAGHRRRYDIEGLVALGARQGLALRYWSGLTFPLSNVLRRVSDRLVERSEFKKLERPLHERTLTSGDRHVPFKTRFPSWMKGLLNRRALWPFDLLQRLFRRSRRSMVLYCEWEIPSGGLENRSRGGGDDQAARAEGHRPTLPDVFDLRGEKGGQETAG